MFHSLYGKLALVLVGMFLLCAGLFTVLMMYSTNLYHQELYQKLNRDLAQPGHDGIASVHAQTDALVAAGCERVFDEIASGARSDRQDREPATAWECGRGYSSRCFRLLCLEARKS